MIRKDLTTGEEEFGVGIRTQGSEKGLWNDRWVFRKYASKEAYLSNKPFDETVIEKGNLLLNTGINEMWKLIIGSSTNTFSNTKAQIGIGDSSTAAVASDTDLKGTNKSYADMASSYPVAGTSQKVVFRAVFGENAGNHDWAEAVVKNKTSNICLNRLVSDQGRKASGQVWTVDLEITLS